MAKCPICDVEVKPRADNPSFPFCTSRCKTIDLGKWVNEEYRVPVTASEDWDEEAADVGEDSGVSSDRGSKTREDMRH